MQALPLIQQAINNKAGSSSTASVQHTEPAWATAAAEQWRAKDDTPMSKSAMLATTMVWRQQATAWDRETMFPYRGPIQGLALFKGGSPVVRQLLRQAREEGKVDLAAAEARYSPEAVATRTVAAASAAIAASASSTSGLVLPATAMPLELRNIAGMSEVSTQAISLTSKLAWDGDSSLGFGIDLSTAVGDSELQDQVYSIFYDTMVPMAPWFRLQVSWSCATC